MFFSHPSAPAWHRVVGPPLEVLGANLRPRCALDEAAWLWHPAVPLGVNGFVRFRLDFDWGGGPLRFSVSADQHYDLALDGERIGRGPDSGAASCWAFETYEGTLAAGRHRLDAVVWWLAAPTSRGAGLASDAPAGRMTWRSGFALAGEGLSSALLHTGFAPWRCVVLDGWRLGGAIQGVYHAIGSALHLDMQRFSREPSVWEQPVSVRAPIASNPHGLLAPGWTLLASGLPSPRSDALRCGEVRATLRGAASPLESPVQVSREGRDAVVEKTWAALLNDDCPLEVPPGCAVSAVCDLRDYHCGYPEVTASGELEVGFFWAEALFLDREARQKGNRDDVDEHWFYGFGDQFVFSSPAIACASSHWWRAGRYLMITVRNRGNQPATLHGLRVQETGYRLGPVIGEFQAAEGEWGRLHALCVRGLRACQHDVFCDTPYYEQMMYTADTRLQALMTYSVWGEDRLARRAIDLQDASRDVRGWTAMRFPSELRQQSSTFAMIWVWMLHDFALWRDDASWWQGRLASVRILLLACEKLRGPLGLIEGDAGWPFIDWVPEWHEGWPPGASERSPGCLVNLAWLITLQKAADLEAWSGCPAQARVLTVEVARLRRVIRRHFFDKSAGLFRDTVHGSSHSEHAQIWGVLAGGFEERELARVREWLLSPPPGTARATVYFQFYLFEAFQRLSLGGEVVERMEFWRDMTERGLVCPVESPEPARSDCHAWSSHPVFHLPATVAGIRPTAPGFAEIRIAPQPGKLSQLSAKIAHPRGAIVVELRFVDRRCEGICDLPPRTRGVFEWAGLSHDLEPGRNHVSCVPWGEIKAGNSSARRQGPHS